VATGYWLLFDLPRARQCNQAWDDIDAIAHTVAASPAPIATRGLESCVELALRLGLDRTVIVSNADRRPPGDVGWMVTSREHPSVAGFALALDQEYRLWRRDLPGEQ
jgi:hypothetical protein